MTIFRKSSPKTGSAAVAKERLLWCVFFDNNRMSRVFTLPRRLVGEWMIEALPKRGKP